MNLTPNQLAGKGFSYRLSSSSTLSGTNVNYVIVPLNQMDNNTLGGSASSGVYTVPISGLYLISASAFSSSPSSTEFVGRLQFTRSAGNVSPRISWARRSADMSNHLPVSGSLVMRMNAGDTVALAVYNNKSTAVVTGGSANGRYTFMSGVYLGA